MALIRGLACSRRTEQGSLEVLVFATMGVKKCGGRLQGSWHRILSLSYLRDVLAKWVLLQSAVCPLLLLLALFHLLSKDDLFWFSTGVFSSLSKRFGRFFSSGLAALFSAVWPLSTFNFISQVCNMVYRRKNASM